MPSKSNDPFQRFRDATLNSSPLNKAVTNPMPTGEETPLPRAARKPREGKTAVYIHMNTDYYKLLKQMRYESDMTYNELINEAVELLLKQSGKI